MENKRFEAGKNATGKFKTNTNENHLFKKVTGLCN